MSPDLHEEIEILRREIHAQSLRIANLEGQFQTTLLSVLKGLKGSDDGSGDGLYERVRSINQMQMTLLNRLAAVEKLVGEHDMDKKAVILSGRTLWFAVTLVAGLVAWLVSLAK